MAGPIINAPAPGNAPTLLLYSFTPKEQGAFRFLLRGFPGIRLIAVPETAYELSLRELLAGTQPREAAVCRAFSRHMLVLAHIPEPLAHPLIAICKQATSEKVLKAMLTETNQHWNSQVLYQNLLEEEAQLGG